MQYINPYDLLSITILNLSDIDSKTVLREKRRLLHEIELSDTASLNYEGFELTKADCIRAVDELDDRNKREFHFFIFKNKPLNAFLTKGNTIFFDRYQAESIYKLPEFLDFISPYFNMIRYCQIVLRIATSAVYQKFLLLSLLLMIHTLKIVIKAHMQ